MLRKIYRHLIESKVHLVHASAAARKHGCMPIVIAGDNMAPTMIAGDIAWIRPCKVSDMQRFDIVGIRRPEWGKVVVPYRLIGLPGDAITLRDGVLMINGDAVGEPFVDRALAEQDYSRDVPEARLEQDCVWILGDNRDMSMDSRNFGALSISLIVGRLDYVHRPGEHHSPRHLAGGCGERRYS